MNWRVQSPVSPTHSQQVRRRLPSNIRVVVDTICLRPLRLCLRLRLRLRLRLHFASAFADLASASDVLACPSSIRRFVSASASAWLLCFRSRLPRCLSACDLLLAQPSTSPIAQWVSLPLARSNTVPFHPPSPLNPLLTCTHKHALPEVRPPLTPPPPVGPPLSYLTSLTHLPRPPLSYLTSLTHPPPSGAPTFLPHLLNSPPPVGPPLSYLTSLTHLPQWGPHSQFFLASRHPVGPPHSPLVHGRTRIRTRAGKRPTCRSFSARSCCAMSILSVPNCISSTSDCRRRRCRRRRASVYQSGLAKEGGGSKPSPYRCQLLPIAASSYRCQPALAPALAPALVLCGNCTGTRTVRHCSRRRRRRRRIGRNERPHRLPRSRSAVSQAAALRCVHKCP